jgi:hypothetical protein
MGPDQERGTPNEPKNSRKDKEKPSTHSLVRCLPTGWSVVVVVVQLHSTYWGLGLRLGLGLGAGYVKPGVSARAGGKRTVVANVRGTYYVDPIDL